MHISKRVKSIFVGTAVSGSHIVLISFSLGSAKLQLRNSGTQNRSSIVVLFSKQLKCSIMSSISVCEQVKSALNSNDEVILRTIYDDLSCRLRSRRVVSIKEHSKAIRSSSSFFGRNFGADSLIQEPAKKGTGSCIAAS